MSEPLELTPALPLTPALKRGDLQHTRTLLNQTFAPVDVARLIESSPPLQRQTLWELIEPEYEGGVLQHLSEEIQSGYRVLG